MKVFADIADNGRRIEVAFNHDPEFIELAKSIPGYSFVKRGHNGGPALRYPLDTESMRRLRRTFGRSLRLAPALRSVGRRLLSEERNLASIALADDANLKRLPRVLPDLYKMTARKGFTIPNYQRADIAFMAAHSCINGNQTGLGKTIEGISATFEANLEDGPHLVSAPVTALVDTWAAELERVQPFPVFTGETVPEREAAIKQAARFAKRDKPFWLVLNPGMIRYEKRRDLPMVSKGGKLQYQVGPRYPVLFEIAWNTLHVDEYHQTGIANLKALAHQAFMDLAAIRKWLYSATPMGGKPKRLYGGLRTVDPEKFTSVGTWYDQWLSIEEKTIGYDHVTGEQNKVKVVEGVRPGLEAEFEKHLHPHLLRRLRKDIMPTDQPEHLEVWCTMTPGQRKQYKQFEANAEIRIEEERLSASGILAEYARLKQFANAKCRVDKKVKYNPATNEHEERLIVWPTPDSGKLAYLVERLDENGVRAGEEAERGARALVGSESRRMAAMVAEQLNKIGIKAGTIAGGIPAEKRNETLRDFRKGRLQVLVVSTKAAGTSLNLEFVNSVHILDETWDPDDQEQLWGRGDRGTREDALIVYWYRTKNTIQEYIQEVAEGKEVTNRNILNIRMEMKALGFGSRA